MQLPIVILTVLFVTTKCLEFETGENIDNNPRTKRTVGVILKNVADVFGYDVIKRPALIIIKPMPQVLSLAPPPAPASPPAPPPAPAPATPPVKAPPPAPAPPAPAPPAAPAPPPPKPALQPPPAPRPPAAPPAPRPPPPIPPAVKPPAFLTPAVRKSFNLNFSWMRGPATNPPVASSPPPPSPPAPSVPPQTLQPPPLPAKPVAPPNPLAPKPTAVPNPPPPPLLPAAPSGGPKPPSKTLVPPVPGRLNNYDDLELNEGDRENPTKNQQDYSGDYNDDRPHKYQLDFPEYENSEERSDYKRHIHPEPFQNHFDDKQKFKKQFDNFWQTSPWTIEQGYRYLTKPIITEERQALRNIPRGFSHQDPQESKMNEILSRANYFPKGFSALNVHSDMPHHRKIRSVNHSKNNEQKKRNVASDLVYNYPKFAGDQFDKELIYGPYRQVNEHILAYLNRNKIQNQKNPQVFDQEKIYGPYRQVNREILNFLHNQFANDAKRLREMTTTPPPADPQKLVYTLAEIGNEYTGANEHIIIGGPENQNESGEINSEQNKQHPKIETANENNEEQDNSERNSKTDQTDIPQAYFKKNNEERDNAERNSKTDQNDIPQAYSKNEQTENIIFHRNSFNTPEEENYEKINEKNTDEQNEKTSDIYDSPKKISITLTEKINPSNYNNENSAEEQDEELNIEKDDDDEKGEVSTEQKYSHSKKDEDVDEEEIEDDKHSNERIKNEENRGETDYEEEKENINNEENQQNEEYDDEDNQETKQYLERETDKNDDEIKNDEEEIQNNENYNEDISGRGSTENGRKYQSNRQEDEENLEILQDRILKPISKPLKSDNNDNFADYIKDLQVFRFGDDLVTEPIKYIVEGARKVEHSNVAIKKADEPKNFDELKHVELYNPYGHHQEMLKEGDIKSNIDYSENKVDALYTLVPAASVRELFRSDKPAAIPFDVEYSGSEESKRTVKKVNIKRSIQPNEATKQKETDEGVDVFISDKFIPEKYDENFSYDFPEPQPSNYAKLETIEVDEDDEKLSPSAKMHWMKSVGVQVNVESRTVQTVTDHKAEEAKVEKSISSICEKLKSELTALHLNIEKQNVVFREEKNRMEASTSKGIKFGVNHQ